MDDTRFTHEARNPPVLQALADAADAPSAAARAMQKDREHLNVLAVFHYILCGAQGLSLLILPLEGLMIYFTLCNNSGGTEADEVGRTMGWWIEAGLAGFVVYSAFWMLCLGLAARDLRLRKHWVFCIVIACIQCLHVPLGTVLGVFSLIILQRASVRSLFKTGDPQPPALPPDQRIHPYHVRQQDKQWLGMLSIFHYVMAGLMAFFCVFPGIYLVLGIIFIAAPPPVPTPGSPSGPPLAVMGWIMVALSFLLMLLFLAQAAAACFNGYHLRQHRRWKLCLVASGIDCLNAPFGTILCVFTVLVLMRQSVRDLFTYGEPVTTTDEDYA